MIVNVHVDCDPLWVYATEYGTTPDFEDESLYRDAADRFLALFAEYGIRATFFLIGRDLHLPACLEFGRKAIAAGHEIGNHTMSHLQDFDAADGQALYEVTECHHLIRENLGYTCAGLRSPGYAFDRGAVTHLRKLGYSYDTSILPGCGVHLMSAVYRLFNPACRQKRFGRWWYLFAKRSPHALSPDCWEVPIATFPLIGLPVHSTFVFQWGQAYFDAAFGLSRVLRSHMVYLFHLIDLLDENAAGALNQHVATFKLPLARRLEIVRHVLEAIATQPVSVTREFLAERSRP